MKKRLFSLWLSLSLATVHAQGPVEGPVSTGYYRVTRFDRIETDRDRTVAEVTFRYFPNYWIRFDSLKCFLRDGDGGRTYRLLAAEGFELNREVYMPESGEVSARLIFEPVDADVRSLDFIDPAEAPESNTYGIRRSELRLRRFRSGPKETGGRPTARIAGCAGFCRRRCYTTGIFGAMTGSLARERRWRCGSGSRATSGRCG